MIWIVDNSHRYITICICKNWCDSNQLKESYYNLSKWVLFLAYPCVFAYLIETIRTEQLLKYWNSTEPGTCVAVLKVFVTSPWKGQYKSTFWNFLGFMSQSWVDFFLIFIKIAALQNFSRLFFLNGHQERWFSKFQDKGMFFQKLFFA